MCPWLLEVSPLACWCCAARQRRQRRLYQARCEFVANCEGNNKKAGCAVRPPMRGGLLAANKTARRRSPGGVWVRAGWEKNETVAGAGGSWAGWRALQSCGSGALSSTGCVRSTTSIARTRRCLCTSAATALLLLPVGDGGGSNEVAIAETRKWGVFPRSGSVVVRDRERQRAGYPLAPVTVLYPRTDGRVASVVVVFSVQQGAVTRRPNCN